VSGGVVLVTGGAGGIGRACGAWFAARRHRVVLSDIDNDAAAAAAAAVGAAAGLRLDVTDEGEVGSLLRAVERTQGPVRIVINAAGVVGPGRLETMSAASWRRVLEVNLTGTFLVCREAIPQLRACGTGKIVNFSSVNARTGGNALSGAAYAASKAGIEALTRHLARLLAPEIQVNAVAPGPVLTPMLARLDDEAVAELVRSIPAGRVATAAEVAEVVGFLASSAADYLTGTTINQSGGQWLG
jgi:NAD(P)-dependent dehydrogenase (short-subunit alcohol dehydrogenase family)